MLNEFYCGDCGDATSLHTVDFGVGRIDVRGRTENHRDVQKVSRCCDGTLYYDECLTKRYEEDD